MKDLLAAAADYQAAYAHFQAITEALKTTQPLFLPDRIEEFHEAENELLRSRNRLTEAALAQVLV